MKKIPTLIFHVGIYIVIKFSFIYNASTENFSVVEIFFTSACFNEAGNILTPRYIFKITVKVVPLPCSLVTFISPSTRSTTLFTSESPSPLPSVECEVSP